jgi:starch phosphorylase
VCVSTVFTTHTPVPAGNEVFDPALVERYLRAFVTDELGLEWDRFLDLGRHGDAWGFGLTPLALRTSAFANGVSELHGEVSRRMWQDLWPDRTLSQTPIGHVTNGVHARTWISRELDGLLRHSGARLEAAPGAQGWVAISEVSDEAVWAAHAAGKERLMAFACKRFVRQGGDPGALRLDADALTIGFARRFATYKRAGLLFGQPDRLADLLHDTERPLQIVLAGKAHPADDGGKELIRSIVELSRDPRLAGRVVFLEDYEMTLARYLVQGVDVWLNTPRRPLEASGTSGMKAAMNGALNCSILDGWWCEGYADDTGFAIGGESVDADEATQDARDAEALFDVLERQVIPVYYDRNGDGVPVRWVAMMKSSIGKLGGRFNTNRMVAEYTERYYLPAHGARQALARARSAA